MRGRLPQISLQQFPAVQPDHDEPSVTLRSIQRLFTFAFCFLIVDGLTPNDSRTNLTPPVTISQSFDQCIRKTFFVAFSRFFFGSCSSISFGSQTLSDNFYLGPCYPVTTIFLRYLVSCITLRVRVNDEFRWLWAVEASVILFKFNRLCVSQRPSNRNGQWTS